MSKRSLLLVLTLGLYGISSAHAATIVWVSDNKTPAAGVPADQAWVDLLVAQGYTVDLSFRNREGRTLDAAKIAALEAADLIIISRDTDSGNYDDGTEPDQWNAITTPIIMQVAHIARNNRWRWLDNGGTNNAQPTLQAVATDHYIFKGVTLDASNQMSVVTTNTSFVSTTAAGNGTMIATRADNGQVWITEWEAGQVFYPGSTQTAGGHRMLFSSGGTSGVSDGTYNLTAEGEKMFINAVRYMLGETGQALGPDPASAQEDMPRDVILSWTPGPSAAAVNGHIVYFSDNEDDVIDGVGGVTVSTNSYAVPQLLEFGTKYYWRVDEVETAPSSKVYQGDIWSFTTEPEVYLITSIQATASSSLSGDKGPGNTVDGSGLTLATDGSGAWVHGTDEKTMWQSAMPGIPATIAFEFDRVYKLQQMKVWNHNTSNESGLGLGAREVTIEIADSNEGPWTLLADVTLNKAPGQPGTPATDTMPMNGVMTSNVRLTIHSNHATFPFPSTGLAEVQFFHIPVAPRQLDPADGTALTGTEVTLAWRSGREAAEHQVYIDVNDNRVLVEDSDPAALAATITAQGSYASYTASGLNLSETYVWKIAEVNTAETPAAHDSPIRSLTTPDYRAVDDFEDYNEDYENLGCVYQTWIDGVGFTNPITVPGNGSGALVGHPTWDTASPHYGLTTVETGIVRSGSTQSMPLYYDNTTAAFSEATRTFSGVENWTQSGIKSLSLWFHGDLGNNGGRLYVKVNNTEFPYDGDAADIQKTQWLPFNIDLSQVGATLGNVTKLTVGVEGTGAKGLVYIDDIRVYPWAPEYVTPAQPDTANLLAYYDFEGNANDRSGHGLDGTVVDGQLASPGKLGQGLGLQVNDAGYADLGNPALLDFGTGDWTVTAWFKTAMTGTGDANQGTICGKGGDNTGGIRYALIMSQNTEGVVTLVCDDDDVGRRDANSSTKTNDDQWHFIVGQREGTAIRIYIDGLLEGTNTIPATYDLSGTSQHNAYIGAMTDNRDGTLYKTFIGSIDEARIYSRALSDAEIAGLAGKTGPTPKPF